MKCYNKSRSNNFLEQKRINNLDMSTYEYVEGDFPAIVSQEVWDKAQKIRESRMKPSLVSTTKTTHSKRDSKDIWVNKIDLIKRYYKDERLSENQHDVVSIRVKIDKAQTCLTNLIAMRQTASCQRKNTRPCGSPLMMKFNSCRKS